MSKSPDAFRTISEVAAWLETPAHVLRFWESRFPELSPVKRAGGRRYYRPEDMQLLGGIKHLLHTEGHTIKSVQDRIKAEGTEVVIAFSPPLGTNGELAGDPDEAADQGAPQASNASAMQAPLADRPPAPAAPEMVAAADLEPDPVPDAPHAANGPPPLHSEDDAPPIGFFFDDSDDAEPAEIQSGTFATTEKPKPMFGARQRDKSASIPEPADLSTPEPQVAQAADLPDPATHDADIPDLEVPQDPSDDEELGTPPVALAARLRAIDRDSLSPDQSGKLGPLAARLLAYHQGKP